jgi:predicted nucleic acid-binding protein
MVLPQPLDEIIFSDENDHFLLELAVTAQATIIVTGDKEMLRVKRISGIEILNPQQFCRKLKIK